MQVNLAQGRHGNLVISVPRTGRTWLFLASVVGTIGLGAASLFSAFPQWLRLGGTLIAASALVLIVWRLLPSGRVEFDARNGNVLKDGRRGLFLGYTRDQIDAASTAARVSGAVGRPVEVAYG